MPDVYTFFIALKTTYDMTYRRNKEFLIFQFVVIFLLNFAYLKSINYSFEVLAYYGSKLRQKFYRLIPNKEIRWIFDCFFSFDILVKELKRKEWKQLFCRGIVYIFALWFDQHTVIMYFMVLTSIQCIILFKFLQHLFNPRQSSFDFESLPFSMQQRFFELQPPNVRYRFSKAYTKQFMFHYYKNLHIDDLNIYQLQRLPKYSKIEEFYDSTKNIFIKARNRAEFIKNLRFNFDVKDGHKIYLLKNITVLNKIEVCAIPEMIIMNEIPLLNNLNLKKLKITNSILTLDDLKVIAKLNLESIELELKNDGSSFMDKMKEILIACEGTPKIKICYCQKCQNVEEFRQYMQKWLDKNVYVKYICCKDELSYDKPACFVFECEDFFDQILKITY